MSTITTHVPTYTAALRSAGENPADIALSFERDVKSGSYNIDATAKNLTASVKGLSPTAEVTAKWSDFDTYGEPPTVKEVPLTYNAKSDAFEGKLPDSRISHVFASGPDWNDYEQNLAISVNGKTLTDPISGEPQFSLNLSKAFQAQSGLSDAAT
jgi:hypothetical protein